jgi:hypothetical protein
MDSRLALTAALGGGNPHAYDSSPLFSVYTSSHDTVGIGFDTHCTSTSGGWVMCDYGDTRSAFNLFKTGDKLKLQYAYSENQGEVITSWNSDSSVAFCVDRTGGVILGGSNARERSGGAGYTLTTIGHMAATTGLGIIDSTNDIPTPSGGLELYFDGTDLYAKRSDGSRSKLTASWS